VLGESRTRTVPAFTIIFFTGNNIAPRGDMASRSLNARLAVSRPDPENREFRHPDPIAWTEAHLLIGSAVEHGADLLVEEIKWLTVNVPAEAPPTRISFRDMFTVFETDEEQSSALPPCWTCSTPGGQLASRQVTS
jgi:hypothetical protein